MKQLTPYVTAAAIALGATPAQAGNPQITLENMMYHTSSNTVPQDYCFYDDKGKFAAQQWRSGGETTLIFTLTVRDNDGIKSLLFGDKGNLYAVATKFKKTKMREYKINVVASYKKGLTVKVNGKKTHYSVDKMKKMGTPLEVQKPKNGLCPARSTI